MEFNKAILVLESGKTFFGASFGANAERFGEVVFNTSMTGYQEILTDPSYKGQIVTMTEPHIGNVGVNPEDMESRQVFAEGFIVREISPIRSNWRSNQSLQDFLIERNVPAITGIDTRALTKHIREAGAMRGIISTTDMNPESLLKKVKDSPQMIGKDWVKEVTCNKSYEWNEGEWKNDSIEQRAKSKEISETTNKKPSSDSSLFTLRSSLNVVVMDFGVKQNILRCLYDRGCRLKVVPAHTTAKEILAMRPDGVMLSNGPGDPAAVHYAIETIKNLIEPQISGDIPPLPIFGICLGHQLLGLALGGKTFKLKFGHRGANHPVKDLSTDKIEITTQNHGFCVDIDSISGKEIELTHINLNDQTAEGFKHKKLPIFSVQYHPESSGGPHDSRYLFDRFVKKMTEIKHQKQEVGSQT